MTQKQTTQTTPTTPTPTPEREKFYEQLQREAVAFAGEQLNKHNMLESMAIVFSYPVISQDLPTAIVMGQTGSLKTPPEFIHAAMQLHKTLFSVVQQGYGMIQALDEQMAMRAQYLKQLEDKIHDTEQRLASSQSTDGGQEQRTTDTPSSAGTDR